jgi:hypothetical protein
VGNLRAVATILAPPTPTSAKPKQQSASFSLVEVSRPTSESDEIPFMNEKSSSVNKVCDETSITRMEYIHAAVLFLRMHFPSSAAKDRITADQHSAADVHLHVEHYDYSDGTSDA